MGEYRKRRLKRKMAVIIIAIFIMLLIIYLILNSLIMPPLIQYADTRVRTIANAAIYASIFSCIEEDSGAYVDILQQDGKVYYIEINNKALSSLASKCAMDVQQTLDQTGRQGIAVPWGTASGIPVFAGIGPSIRVSFEPKGTAQVNYSSEFRAAGINQTIHRIEMDVQVDIALVLPGYVKSISTNVDMTVAEHIIVGDVPNVYASPDDQLLNFVPEAPLG